MATKQLLLARAVAGICLIASQCALGQTELSIGEQLAQESVLIVRFTELANIGSRDTQCAGTRFPTGSVPAIIDKELESGFRALAYMHKVAPDQATDTLNLLRQFPLQRVDGQLALPRTYEFLKQKAIREAGAPSACTALAERMRVVLHESRQRHRAIVERIRRSR